MRTFALLTLIAVAVALARAEEPEKKADKKPAAEAVEAQPRQDTSLDKFLQTLKDGLNRHESLKFSDRNAAVVAAVRGAEQKTVDSKKPYFKKAASTAARSESERAEFEKAVDQAMAGKVPEAIAALESFEKAHPKSGFLPDVKQALDQLKGSQVQTQPPAEAPTEPPKEKSKESK